jgi:hypothetical protein
VATSKTDRPVARHRRIHPVVAAACLVALAVPAAGCSGGSGGGSRGGSRGSSGGSSGGGSTAAATGAATSACSRAAASTTPPPKTTYDKTGYPHPGPCEPAMRPGERPSGDVALLAMVRRAYLGAPGLELTTATAPAAIATAPRFVLQLHRDLVVGEEYVDPRPGGVTLVTRSGFPTYARAGGQACWRPLAPPDARNLVNVPGPFPDDGKVERLTPSGGFWRGLIETHSSFWFLPSRVTRPTVKDKSFLLLAVSPRSHRIESIRVGQPDPAVAARLRVIVLPVSPAIPTPTPTCAPGA